MKKNIIFLLIFLISISISNAQIDTTYIKSFDSTYNYFIFKPSNITVSELINKNNFIFKLSQHDFLIQNRIIIDGYKMKHYRYSQYYNDIKVEDSQFYILADSNNIPITANGELYYKINTNTIPTISKTQAINTALLYSNATEYFWQDTTYEKTIKELTNNPDTSYYPNAELIIFNINANQPKLTPVFVLTYKIPIFSLIPFDAYYLYIDALNGNIVSKRQIMKSDYFNNNKTDNDNEKYYYNSNINSCDQPCNQASADLLYYNGQYIYTDKFMHIINCTYRTKNTCTNTFLYVVKANGNDYRDDNNLWLNSNDRPGVTALWCLERIHDFFRSYPYYRNSFDGNSSQVKLFAEKQFTYTDCNDNTVTDGQNAMWAGTHIEVGDGSHAGSCPYHFNNDLTTLDIIGHEFTHGITDNEADLIYQGESGALNESFSDIFGTMIDFYGKTNYNTGLQPNYLLGEECTSSGMLRNMADPNSSNQPDTYEGDYWVDPIDINNDYGGVHYNSGVQNFWFYLLSEGGSDINDLGNSYCVKTIGREKAARIAYKALTEHLGPSSQYIDSRYFTIKSAEEIFGNNSDEVAQVTSAWYAVGVGLAYTGTIVNNDHTVSGTEFLSYNNEILFNDLQVPSGTSLTITSNTKIIMNSTSTASSGSYFHAYIADGCMGGAKINNSNNDNNYTEYNMDQEEINKTDTNIVINNKFLLIPNPNNGNMQVFYEIPENSTGIFEVYNQMGKNLFSYSLFGGKNTISISRTDLDQGIYFYRTTAGNEIIAADKIVVIK